MARRGSYYRRPRGRGPKRNLFWARSSQLQTLEDGAQSNTTDLLGNFQTEYGADLFGFTVTRILGFYTWYTTSSPTAETSYILSAGIRMDENSEVAGSNNTEKTARLPLNDPYADWMWARNEIGISASDTYTRLNEQVANNTKYLDLKSQRRASELKTSLYLFSGANNLPDADTPVYFYYDLHILLKQP